MEPLPLGRGARTSFCALFLTERATTETYTPSLHGALPICDRGGGYGEQGARGPGPGPNQGREREEFNNDRDGDPPNDWIHDKLVEREKARMTRDFGTADARREELFKAGHR